ncbi:MAG: signal recognition particle protein [Deltaproteobacteria bacterium]|nr:signal recognition particle protein [Deltaproteobacteria bacterium]MBI5810529.1 signal recognition particle protein [Deltaproteobacteria bacterium]
MFESLSDKLRKVIREIKGQGTLSESNIHDALKEVRLALLEADVNFRVVKDFVDAVKEKAMGGTVMESLTPGNQFIKVVYDELTSILGKTDAGLELKGRPAVIMLTGLQGSGKTTTIAKLALLLKKRGRNPYIVPADLFRLAAVLQMKKLATEIKVDCFDSEAYKSPADICREALRIAGLKGYDTLLVDTAGRLHIDTELMDELKTLKGILDPSEILFVADSMTGQDAVNTAKGFDSALGITGVILTKFDGDARGGAALSMRMSTGRPIKFIGTGEKVDCLEVFHPERVAGRILDMGDVLTLIEKAGAAFDEKESKELEKKIKKDTYTLDDFKNQLAQIKKLGSLDSILSMVPGFDAMKQAKGLNVDDKEIVRIEAIINSMTGRERTDPSCLNASRRQRIAKGSGTKVQDVNKFINQYLEMKKMMRKFKNAGPRGMKGLMQNWRQH